MTNTAFFDHSKEVAKKFINTVSYIDDLIYSKSEESVGKTDVTDKDTGKVLSIPNRETVAETPVKRIAEKNDSKNEINNTEEHKSKKEIYINPHQFTSSFIKQGIHCSLIEIEEDKEDLENVKKILRKSDIVILDWQMHNDRGEKAKDLLISLISKSEQNEPELRLYIIYTKEKNYKEIIYNDIYPKLTEKNISIENVPNQDDCSLKFGHTKILVLNKDEKLNEKYAVNENDLPDRVIEEFTEMTSGLLSNFALHSLTTIRENFHKILGLYSKELDAAYLGHKVLLPNTEDAEHLLCELFKDSIGDLLFYHNTKNFLADNFIKKWINENVVKNEFSILKGDGSEYNPIERITCDKKNLSTLFSSKEIELNKRFNDAFDVKLNGNKVKYLTQKSTSLFLRDELRSKEDEYNIRFAKLTHHKNLFIPYSISPILSLGTILHRIDRKKKSDHEYYICIQQKCDCLRIEEGEERKFLFLPLNKSEDTKPFDILTHDGTKLRIDKKTFFIKTMKFKRSSTKGTVIGRKNKNGIFIFKSIHDETFEWVLDLKDLHSQRIVTEYASLLFRVGLDESEWLRRNATN